MKLGQLILTVILSVGVSLAAVSYFQNQNGTVTTQENAYDRVLRTKTLRCGYAEWPPDVFVKDPTTGEVRGMDVDIINALAKKLDLKVDWAESTGWGSFIESLKAHRIDVMCAPIWRNGQRGRYAIFTAPFFYSPLYAYVPVNEHRFDKDVLAANSRDVRISAMDGEMSDIIAKEHFPQAKEISLPQMSQPTDMLINLTNGKADIVFSEPSFVDGYMKNNPGKIRQLSDKPFQFFATAFPVEIHEVQLRDMLDSALVELLNQGVIDEIISKYNGDPKAFLRVAKPYAQ